MRAKTVMAAIATAGAMAVGTATPAAAAPRDGRCDPTGTYGNGFGEACFYWLTNRTGSLADFSAENPANPDLYVRDPTLADDVFLSGGGGQGQRVDNNAESVCNTDWYPLVMFQGTNYTGWSLRLNSKMCFLDLGGWKNTLSSYYWTFS
jgi:hypothetical protein